ncbi:B-cell differentiation antigen CD72-like [Hyla sarda]|uniref:B-cell differentiation antigen CD72-like n=1 Tax=Hyla sarda TaxID=327740 RepID=UPI0024C44F22|nr:B-cell differentiation antigen CD72-like [Hyla sarda]
MADAVTYTDLKFFKNLPREKGPSDNEEDNDQSEVLYENVERPSRKNEAPTAPPVGTSGSQHLKTRFQRSSPVLALLLLVFCLVLLTAAAVMTVKYISVSREAQFTSAGHMELSRKLKDREDLLQRVREELKRSQEELKRSQEELQHENHFLNITLQEAESRVKDLEATNNRATEDQRNAETRQNETISRLDSIQKGLCGEAWTLFGRRCLLFLDHSYPMSWDKCRTFCEGKKSNLLLVKKEDSEIQDFLKKRNKDYWVGKEMTISWTPRWYWPPDYGISYSWNCGTVSGGELGTMSCNTRNYCACEQSLLQVQGLCGENWTWFDRRCLSFSSKPMIWDDCRTFCEREKSNLLVVKKEDTKLKDFLKKRNKDYWVGKEMTISWTPRWYWPPDYGIPSVWYCGKVNAGVQGTEFCSKSNYCACEQNLVHVEGLSESSPESSKMVLWENKYKCPPQNQVTPL